MKPDYVKIAALEHELLDRTTLWDHPAECPACRLTELLFGSTGVFAKQARNAR